MPGLLLSLKEMCLLFYLIDSLVILEKLLNLLLLATMANNKGPILIILLSHKRDISGINKNYSKNIIPVSTFGS